MIAFLLNWCYFDFSPEMINKMGVNHVLPGSGWRRDEDHSGNDR